MFPQTSRIRAWPPTWSIDRDAASRLGITAAAIDSVLYDAFGQREVSTMYTALNQYFVVMEVDPKYQLSPDALNGIFIKASTRSTSPATRNCLARTAATTLRLAPARMVPLSTIAHYEQQRTPLQVSHQGQYPAVTLTFNLAPNVALGDAVTALEKVQLEMGMPPAFMPPSREPPRTIRP